ncbi:hypothetical protein cu1303 [Corynebacterium urealyticum DSM 7109]|uniref:Uncharacterized protein n=1 Tax=Corynebacterium urealyticum (strain ATCC 43042 / DSM 7109) TaxID=504474 RepID=B1VGF7_CORU7|nr:hypothetical protein cu1303 [Corynebacterium urealyticum DSM 7109]
MCGGPRSLIVACWPWCASSLKGLFFLPSLRIQGRWWEGVIGGLARYGHGTGMALAMSGRGVPQATWRSFIREEGKMGGENREKCVPP